MDEEEINRKLQDFEAMRQTYLSVLYQKEKIEEELMEVENAVKELNNLPNDKKVYKLVGNVLIEKGKDDLIKELEERKEVLNIRLQSIGKQESTLKDRLSKMQIEIENLLKQYKETK